MDHSLDAQLNLIQSHHYCVHVHFSVCASVWMGVTGHQWLVHVPPLRPNNTCLILLRSAGSSQSPKQRLVHTRTYSCVTEGSGMHNMCVCEGEISRSGEWDNPQNCPFAHARVAILNYSFLCECVDVFFTCALNQSHLHPTAETWKHTLCVFFKGEFKCVFVQELHSTAPIKPPFYILGD